LQKIESGEEYFCSGNHQEAAFVVSLTCALCSLCCYKYQRWLLKRNPAEVNPANIILKSSPCFISLMLFAAGILKN